MHLFSNKKLIFISSIFFGIGLVYTTKKTDIFSYNKSVHIKTIYGDLFVQEPVIKELLATQAMKRLKKINQYGVMKIVKPYQNYTRYEHSLAVFYLLRTHGASLEEQVAGLLHDVSHTAFSHVIDFVHGTVLDKYSYQDTIFEWYLESTGLLAILKKYNLERVAGFGKTVEYKMLKDNLPYLCADRIEYNIYGGYVEGWITKEQAYKIAQDIIYKDGKWMFTNKESAKQFAKISIDLSTQNWCSVENGFLSQQLAEIIKRGLQLGIITNHDLHFSVDDLVWDKLKKSEDKTIQKLINRIHHHNTAYQEGTKKEYDQYFKGKFRGIDPLILTDNGPRYLSELDESSVMYCKASAESVSGHYIKYVV